MVLRKRVSAGSGEPGTYGKVLGEGREVRGKEADAADVGRETVQHCERDRHPVVRRRPASELVEDHERFGCRLHESAAAITGRTYLFENLGRVVHLDLEGGCVGKDEVVGAHSRVDGVDGSDASLGGRDEAADWSLRQSNPLRVGARTLGHDDRSTRHAEHRTLSRHL